MAKINNNLNNITDENTFQSLSKRIAEFKSNNKDIKLVSLGIGDVSLPVIKPIINAMKKAVDDLSDMETFKGYGSYYGYEFLKNKIRENDYKGLNISNNEIYISDGAKTDVSNILELFDINSKICIPSVMYPIYRDASLCLNRKVSVIKCYEKNNFMPNIPKEKYDIIYICSPSNPLGIAYSKEELSKWIDYAIKNNSIILYDNVYYPFIKDNNKPVSIYEIENAKKVAIEFRSFSKKASFTGVRCSYFVIPDELNGELNYYWRKRTINRFNGADYIAQRGAEASYFEESKELLNNDINYYLDNGKLLIDCFTKLGFKVMGGVDSPYLWIKIKDNMSSWEYFEFILEKLNIIIIPGIIFGEDGDNYFRVSSLGNKEETMLAIRKFEDYYEKKI